MVTVAVIEWPREWRGWDTATSLDRDRPPLVLGRRTDPGFPRLERTRMVSSLEIVVHAPRLPLRTRLDMLQRRGWIRWGGQLLQPIEPVARVRGNPTIADLVVAERHDGVC